MDRLLRALARATRISTLLLGSCLLLACSAPAPLPDAAGDAEPDGLDADPDAGPDGDLEPSDADDAEPDADPERDGDVEPLGGDRPVELHLPGGYSPGTPAPLLILLHGYGVDGAWQDAYFRLGPEASRRGMLFAHPDGTVGLDGSRFWNATDACCDLYGSGVDDSGYLQDLIEQIRVRHEVDPRRIYVAGYSNGAFMAHRLACDRADLVAALVSFAGSTFLRPERCVPSEAVAVLQVHGTADMAVPYLGTLAYPGAETTVRRWAELDGCDLGVVTDGPRLDLDLLLPGDDTRTSTYGWRCAPGGHAELWTIEGGVHMPSLQGDFAVRLVDFLLEHPKPER